MKEKQILKKAIEKAISNGYSIDFPKEKAATVMTSFEIIDGLEVWVSSTETMVADYIPYFAIVFRHDFAKAFFGYETIRIKDDEEMEVFDNSPWDYKCPAWEYRLQEMVLKENPLQYLAKFL